MSSVRAIRSTPEQYEDGVIVTDARGRQWRYAERTDRWTATDRAPRSLVPPLSYAELVHAAGVLSTSRLDKL